MLSWKVTNSYSLCTVFLSSARKKYHSKLRSNKNKKGKCKKHMLKIFTHSSVQFSSVTQSCPTLCDPMNCSTSGLPVHHQLPVFTQTHVHSVGDAIQPSHSFEITPYVSQDKICIVVTFSSCWNVSTDIHSLEWSVRFCFCIGNKMLIHHSLILRVNVFAIGELPSTCQLSRNRIISIVYEELGNRYMKKRLIFIKFLFQL